MRAPLLPLSALISLLALSGAASRADELVTDLSDHVISITSSFQGTNLLLFGTLQAGDANAAATGSSDIVVVVRGPVGPVTVRKKERLAGLWINRGAVRFNAAPGFYAVLSNRPLDAIAGSSLLRRHQIGLEHLDVEPVAGKKKPDIGAYQQALIRRGQQSGLFIERDNAITFLGNTLFRTDLHFPATVPVGDYRAEVYLLRDGQVIGAQASPLFINKSGFERRVFMLAHDDAVMYGLLAIVIALVAGWLADAVFRRD